MLKTAFLVGFGSFFGGMFRYLMSYGITRVCAFGFPWATMTINVLGCFLIGVLYGLFSRYELLSSHCCLFLTAGVCGGFTTFSTFANDSLNLLQTGNTLGFIAYSAISVFVGIGMTALGYALIR